MQQPAASSSRVDRRECDRRWRRQTADGRQSAGTRRVSGVLGCRGPFGREMSCAGWSNMRRFQGRPGACSRLARLWGTLYFGSTSACGAPSSTRTPTRASTTNVSSQLKDQYSTKAERPILNEEPPCRFAPRPPNVCRQLLTTNPACLQSRLSCLHLPSHGIGMWRLLANLALPSSCTHPLSEPSSVIPPSPSVSVYYLHRPARLFS